MIQKKGWKKKNNNLKRSKREKMNGRPFLHPTVIIINYSNNPSLLQHYFRTQTPYAFLSPPSSTSFKFLQGKSLLFLSYHSNKDALISAISLSLNFNKSSISSISLFEVFFSLVGRFLLFGMISEAFVDEFVTFFRRLVVRGLDMEVGNGGKKRRGEEREIRGRILKVGGFLCFPA